MSRILQQFNDFAFFATFFVAIILLCGIAEAEENHFFENNISQSECEDGTFISGRVQVSGIGTGLENVPIVLIPSNSKNGDAIIRITDSSGDFKFEGLSDQEYFVQVMDVNLHAVRGYKRSNGNLIQQKPHQCTDEPLIFEYNVIESTVVGGLIWYDLNGNGFQDEWFDADDDGRVTLNKPDASGNISLENFEWIDLNGDGRYSGAENIGEMNHAGLSNLLSGNVVIERDNFEIFRENIGVTGYYFHYQNDSGSYTAAIEIDGFLYESINKFANSGLVKILPNFGARTSPYIDENDGLECGPTQVDSYEFTMVGGTEVRLDLAFGIRCQEWMDRKIVVANDDNFGEIPFDFDGVIGNILANDRINNREIDFNEVNFVFEELDNIIGLLINENGDLSLVPGLNEPRTYTLRYVLTEVGNPVNSDAASVTFQILNKEIILSLTKTSNSIEIFEGDTFDYIIELTNTGNTSVSDVTITDNLPFGISYQFSVMESENISDVITEVSGRNISYKIQNLPRGGRLRIILTVKADQLNNPSPLPIVNTVVVTSSEVEEMNSTASDTNVINPFFIPNVITPNGDGKNDAFEIRGLTRFASTNLVIFNRYGDHVYESKDYQNDWAATGLPNGTYYFVLQTTDAEGRSNEFKNWIQVIK